MEYNDTITILKTTQRNALLITDGERVAWVMGRTRRADGTFTPSALQALADGKPVAEWQAEEEARQKAIEERKLSAEERRELMKQPASITLPASVKLEKGSEKSYKIRLNTWRILYGKRVHNYGYLPMTLISVSYDGNGDTVLTMPRWFLEKSGWLRDMAQTK